MAKQKLTIICGLPGTGKTVVARLVAKSREAALLRSDVLRRELLATPTYADGEKQAVYDEMFARAKRTLFNGRSVVLDAAFNKRVNREKAAALAAALKVDFEITLVTSSEEAIRDRLLHRVGDESDADWRIYQFLKSRFERIDEEHVVITNDGDLASLEREVRRLLL
ncbi:MAG: AAA family ATPase [Alphaproteobacteria bacterium]|nr:AAA family ATPase [Alphaproteobacteria bacterium]